MSESENHKILSFAEGRERRETQKELIEAQFRVFRNIVAGWRALRTKWTNMSYEDFRTDYIAFNQKRLDCLDIFTQISGNLNGTLKETYYERVRGVIEILSRSNYDNLTLIPANKSRIIELVSGNILVLQTAAEDLIP